MDRQTRNTLESAMWTIANTAQITKDELALVCWAAGVAYPPVPPKEVTDRPALPDPLEVAYELSERKRMDILDQQAEAESVRRDIWF